MPTTARRGSRRSLLPRTGPRFESCFKAPARTVHCQIVIQRRDQGKAPAEAPTCRRHSGATCLARTAAGSPDAWRAACLRSSADPTNCGGGAGGSVALVRAAVGQISSTVDAPQEIASRPAVARLLLGAFGEAVGAAALLQSVFRWFVGLSLVDEVWNERVFTKNRERLIGGDIARKFRATVLDQGSVKATNQVANY